MCLVVEPSGCLEHRDDIGAARGLSYGIRVRANTNSRNRKITAGNVTLKELVDFSEKLKNVNYTKINSELETDNILFTAVRSRR